MVDSWSVLLASLFVPLTAGIWFPRSNGPGAIGAVVVGLTAWLFFIGYFPDLPGDLMAVPFAAIALVVISLLTGKTSPPEPLRDADGQTLEYNRRLGWSSSTAA